MKRIVARRQHLSDALLQQRVELSLFVRNSYPSRLAEQRDLSGRLSQCLQKRYSGSPQAFIRRLPEDKCNRYAEKRRQVQAVCRSDGGFESIATRRNHYLAVVQSITSRL